MKHVKAILIAVLLMFAVSCGGSDGPGRVEGPAGSATPKPLSPELQEGFSGQLPQLTELPAGIRDTSNSPQNFLLLGGAFEPSLTQNAALNGNLLDFTPGADYAWAVYAFNLSGFSEPGLLDIWWDGQKPDSANYYVGVSNHGSGRWRFMRGPASGTQLDFGSLAGHFSASDKLHVAVLLTGTGSFSLERLRLGGNIPPVISLVPDNTIADSELFVIFDASATEDLDGNVVSYAWQFEGIDPFVDFFWNTADYFYAHVGEYTCTLRATDNDGGVSEESVSITVNAVPGNLDPVADIMSDISKGVLPLAVNFDASASSDPDGNVAAYRWDFDGDGYHESGGGAMPEHTFIAPGEQTVSVLVIDNQGSFDTAELVIDVDPVEGTEPPVAMLTADYVFQESGSSRIIDASGSTDPDNDIIKYEWDLEGDGVFDFDYGLLPYVDAVYTQDGGIYNATVRVTDSGGRTDTASLAMTVQPWSGYDETEPNDTPPGADSFAEGFMTYGSRVGNWRGRLGEGGDFNDWYVFTSDRAVEIGFQALFTHAEGDIDIEIYTADNLTVPFAFSPGVEDNEFMHTTLPAPGTYYLLVYIPDLAINKGPVDYVLNCHQNLLPVAALTCTPASGIVPFPITLDASASMDPDGEIFDWHFDFNGDGIYEVVDNSDPVYLDNFVLNGVFDVGVRVFDDLGWSSTASFEVTGN